MLWSLLNVYLTQGPVPPSPRAFTGSDAALTQPVITPALYHQEESDVRSRKAFGAILLTENAD